MCLFGSSHKQKDYATWTDMLHIKDIYFSGIKMVVGDGKRTHFWGDSWCGFTPLKDKFHDLFDICNEQDLIVAAAASRDWMFTFRRRLYVDLQIQMDGLHMILCSIHLTSTPDKPVWRWTKDGVFTVRSLYKQLCSNGIDRSFKHVWKAKIPLKIKLWLWLLLPPKITW
jgi:hypothetical protein